MRNNNLELDLISLWEIAPGIHPNIYVESLGIRYLVAVPQTLYETWEFYCCSNVPENLPECLTKLKRVSSFESEFSCIDEKTKEKIRVELAKLESN